MRVIQTLPVFAPITFIIETKEEAELFWELLESRFSEPKNNKALDDMARKMSNWFSTEAKL